MSKLRKILLPFSLLYWPVVRMRNFLYDKEIFESVSFDTPIIVVGNLNVGGTGKTPMIEYLLEMLTPRYEVATLSRGYGRKTKGYLELSGKESAEKVGDEPLQFKTKFPGAIVVVDENRKRGISRIISEYNPEAILLDDAYQHRKVKAGLSILLTSFDQIYSEDLLLPAGNLRETPAGAGRANVIIVTKCPETLNLKEQENISKKLNVRPYQKLLFSFIQYSDVVINKNSQKVSLKFLKGRNFTLITGIAKPQPLLNYLKKKSLKFDHQQYPDHHNFSKKDLEEISNAGIILTTEKDFMRLKSSIAQQELYYIPIRTKFIDREEEFQSKILNFINEK